MKDKFKLVSCMVAAAMVLAGCGGSDGGGDGDGSAASEEDTELIVQALLSALTSVQAVSGGGGMASRVQGSVSVTYSPNPPTSYPITVNMSFVNEPMPCASGSSVLNGTMSMTVNASGSFSATASLTSSYNNCEGLDGSVVLGFTMSGSSTSGTIRMTYVSDDLGIDGDSFTIDLVANASFNQSGLTSCTITGTINGCNVVADLDSTSVDCG